jgi:hypothetical protein
MVIIITLLKYLRILKAKGCAISFGNTFVDILSERTEVEFQSSFIEITAYRIKKNLTRKE